MKNKIFNSKIIVGLSICIILSVFGFTLAHNEIENNVEITYETQGTLSTEEKLADLDFLYTTIEENYPYLQVNKRLYGVDWLETKDKYIKKIKDSKTDEEFAQALNESLMELHNGHTHVLNKKYVVWMRDVYKTLKDEGYWQGMLYDVLNDPLVLSRYHIEDNTITSESTGDSNANNSSETVAEESTKPANVYAGDIIENQIGYIKINQMLSFWEIDEDRKIIDPYITKIKDYPALVIDIRGNGGGDTRYWSDYLVPLLIEKPLKTDYYTFFKDGEEINRFTQADQMEEIQSIEDLDLSRLKNLPPEVKEDFKYYSASDYEAIPSKESVGYKGKVYLLVDRGVFSSSEAFAVFAKQTGFATLVGGTTGGDGIGSDPMLTMLPNSGLVIRYTKEMGTAADGTCNEEHKTTPNVEVNDTRITTELKDDECIKKVLELEKDNSL